MGEEKVLSGTNWQVFHSTVASAASKTLLDGKNRGGVFLYCFSTGRGI
jgi:hypothetical protein